MKRIWITFTERQSDRLHEDARERRIPIAEILRGLVEQYYGLEHERVEPGRAYRSPPGEQVIDEKRALLEQLEKD